MAPRRRRALQRLHGLLEAREDVRLADRFEAGDLARQVVDAAERLGPDHPVGLLVERHDAHLVALGERGRRTQDGLLADVDLAHAADARAAALVERVAVAGVHRAGLVDDDDEGDVRLLLAVADAHVDRQGLLERRALVATGAVRVAPTDHDQALAEVPDVDLQGRQLAVRRGGPVARPRARRCRRWRATRSRSGAPRGRSCRRAGAGSRGRPRVPRRRVRRRRARGSSARP